MSENYFENLETIMSDVAEDEDLCADVFHGDRLVDQSDVAPSIVAEHLLTPKLLCPLHRIGMNHTSGLFDEVELKNNASSISTRYFIATEALHLYQVGFAKGMATAAAKSSHPARVEKKVSK